MDIEGAFVAVAGRVEDMLGKPGTRHRGTLPASERGQQVELDPRQLDGAAVNLCSPAPQVQR